jgi:hypothetical protein
VCKTSQRAFSFSFSGGRVVGRCGAEFVIARIIAQASVLRNKMSIHSRIPQSSNKFRAPRGGRRLLRSDVPDCEMLDRSRPVAGCGLSRLASATDVKRTGAAVRSGPIAVERRIGELKLTGVCDRYCPKRRSSGRATAALQASPRLRPLRLTRSTIADEPEPREASEHHRPC